MFFLQVFIIPSPHHYILEDPLVLSHETYPSPTLQMSAYICVPYNISLHCIPVPLWYHTGEAVFSLQTLNFSQIPTDAAFLDCTVLHWSVHPTFYTSTHLNRKAAAPSLLRYSSFTQLPFTPFFPISLPVLARNQLYHVFQSRASLCVKCNEL